VIFLATAGERCVTLQVRVAVAEHQLSGGESLEQVADFQLVRHAHAAVQLHRLLPDEPACLTDHRLGRRQGPAAFAGVLHGTAQRSALAPGAGRFEMNQHVGDAVLQRLEPADGLAELLAHAHVVDGGIDQRLHDADSVGA
jgi:hypothetical protein